MSMPALTLEQAFSTPDGFRAWLESKGRDAIVGERCSPCYCPLAQYGTQVCGKSIRVVNFGDLWAEEITGRAELRLPRWAHYVVGKIDRTVVDGEPVAFVVTAADALAYLDDLPVEVRP